MLKRPTYHLRAFAACLAVILVALVAVLFGVHMEAVTHGTGIVKVRGMVELRAEQEGLAELGWYEGEVLCSGNRLRIRLDAHGNGMSDPAQGESRKIEQFRCPEGNLLTLSQFSFHKLESSDRLWSGQAVGSIRSDNFWRHLEQMLTSRTVAAPVASPFWQVLKVGCEPGQAVKPGDVLAWLAPIDPATGKPHSWIAQVNVLEKNAAGIEVGQEVRLISVMYNQRLHGRAVGVVEKMEPLAEPAENGERSFQVQVKITHAPFPLHHGMTVKAEIIIGHKSVCRIILEH
jgi:HlyD family secretion protein